MKIAVDARPLLAKRTGIGRYTFHILQELARMDKDNDYFLCGTLRPMHKTCLADVQGIGQTGFKVPFPFKKAVRLATQLYTHMAIRRVGAQVYWGTSFFGLFGKSFKTAITIHDMAYQVYPQCMHPGMGRDLKRKLGIHAAKADLILTESLHTKADIVRFLGVRENKIRVVYDGVDSAFRVIGDQEALEETRRKVGLPKRFILFVGMLEPRKNIVGLIRAFQHLAQKPSFAHDLVLAGPKGWQYKEMVQAASDTKDARRIHFIGYVADEDLPSVYNLADAFVYPSFYEGFGLPVLEAMACGVPVITSNVSCLPEVGGEAAMYVDPNQPEQLADAISRVLQDKDLRQDLRNKGLLRAKEFSWAKAARETLNALVTV